MPPVMAGIGRPVCDDSVDGDQRAVDDHVGVPSVRSVPQRSATPGARAASSATVSVAPRSDGAGAESGGQLGGGLALMQVDQDRQGLSGLVELAPRGADLLA